MVVIAGPYGSGKTTILTALFEAFLEAPFANYMFRGSETLVGFEKRCHLGREESGHKTADTAHTSRREGVVFLHLDLAYFRAEKLSNINLLLSDVSGELFGRLRDSTAAVKDLGLLRRADSLCLIVDGEKIVDPEQREIALSDSRSILRSIVEGGVLHDCCRVDLVFSKWDVVKEALNGSDAGLQSFVTAAETKLKAAAGGRAVSIHQIAARPPVTAHVPFAFGLPTLLRGWTHHDEEECTKSQVFLPPKSAKEYDFFTAATLRRSQLEDVYSVSTL